MRRSGFGFFVVGYFTAVALAAPKPHVINFGKGTSIKWCVGPEGKCLDLKGRALYVDGRLKEFTLGSSHDLTERLFVVRRAFRINDSLPGDAALPARYSVRGHAADLVTDNQDEEDASK